MRDRPAPPLSTALLDPACYPHPAARVRVLETHLSWVFLTGRYAYKVKKPVDLGFANFTTLERRRRYCEEELRLNRRLAPALYLDVVAIRGEARAPRIGGTGPVLDYAVKMREFPQRALASRRIAGGGFGAAEIDAVAALIAQFHAAAPAARRASRHGTPRAVLAAAQQNFEQLQPLVNAGREQRALRALRRWTEREHRALRDVFARRRREGFVRECHGDLHLGNIALIDGRPLPFDCIEFNLAFRWIDVMSEVAFLAMDLEDRGQRALAWRFLNRYLEATGDYAGIPVLRFYMVYRALVRAKVHLMRSRQPHLPRREKTRLSRAFREYLQLAARCAAPGRAALMITHGPSGCGKTTATQPLIELLGAVRIRSDLERKRLHRLAPLAASGSGLDAGIYTRAAGAATYRRLGALARTIVRAGFPVVIDAAFLERPQRIAFRALAERLEAAFLILDFRAPVPVLRARIARRRARANDASEADVAVLERQLATRDPLTPAETAAALAVDAAAPLGHEAWRPVFGRLRRMAG